MIPVAFDLRDPQRSGIARVATSIARAFLQGFSDQFAVTLVGPVDVLQKLQAPGWGPCRLVDWKAGRYSLTPEWARVQATVGPALWYFAHWDVPPAALLHRFVLSLHDLAHLRLSEFSLARRIVARQWMRVSLARARRVLAVSQFTAREAVAEWPGLAPRISVAHNGVDERFFQPSPPLDTSVASRIDGHPYMLSVGIRKARKNLALGVDLLRHLAQLRWVVVGEWYPEWAEVHSAAERAGVADRMVVLDRASDDELLSLYGAAAFLFFPSRYEGFGLPALEAMACGAPVLAARGTGLGEVVGDAGWLRDPGDTMGFIADARAILELGTRRAAVVEKGRARAREFTWERAAAALADAFRGAARQ